MGLAPGKVTAIAAALTVYFLNSTWRFSWFWGIPIYALYFITWHACRMFIYEPYYSPLSKVPGPKGHWFHGEFKAILNEEPGQAHLKWMRQYRNPTGLVVYPGLFRVSRVMPTSAATIQHILNEWTLYVKPEQSRRALANILGNGLLTAEGETHRRQRKVLTPAFATSYIRDNMPIFSAKAADLVDVLKKELPNQSTNGVEVFGFLSRATLDIIGSAGFGYEFNSLHNPDDPFAKAYAQIFHQTTPTRFFNIAANYLPFLGLLPFPRVLEVRAARKAIVEQATKLVRDKEAKFSTEKDILSLMIAENRKEKDEKLAEMELVDQVMTFLLAGHETTSTALAWTLFTLAQHQDIQKRLRDEVKHFNNPTFEQIESCRYLNNVCREMLRFIPPVSVTNRTASKDDVINGIKIPKGTIIFIPITAINCDETVWGPDADEFNPDRWDKLPSAGPRSCIGRRFSETEMKVLLVSLIQNLQFEQIEEGQKVEKQAIITTRPKGGMHLKLSAVE